MLKGLYTAATGLIAIESRQAVLANNIANASTAGFRRQEPIQKGFYDLFVGKLSNPFRFDVDSAPGGGTKVDETYSDTSEGAVSITGDPLNVALIGPGFLTVRTPQGERFTRSGKLSIDVDRQLSTVDGDKVLGESGLPIDVDGASIRIAEDGQVYVDGTAAGALRVVEFEDPHMLTREGEALYRASDEALARSGGALDTTVRPGALEMSNVNLPTEMVNMIVGLRAYAANQKMINAVDETMSKLIDQVGMPV